MNMDPDFGNFQELRRLLALKRHEQPPPGYWDNFSSKVISRIEAGEPAGADSLAERLFGPASLLGRLWTALELRPALAGAFGVAVCGLVISGIFYSEGAGSTTLVGPVANVPVVGSTDLAALPSSMGQADLVSSTNPAPAIGALFNRAQAQFGLQVQSASFPVFPKSPGN